MISSSDIVIRESYDENGEDQQKNKANYRNEITRLHHWPPRHISVIALIVENQSDRMLS